MRKEEYVDCRILLLDEEENLEINFTIKILVKERFRFSLLTSMKISPKEGSFLRDKSQDDMHPVISLTKPT